MILPQTQNGNVFITIEGQNDIYIENQLIPFFGGGLIAKYTSSGQFLWGKPINNTSQSAMPKALTIDNL
jgi:hypothetical protein